MLYVKASAMTPPLALLLGMLINGISFPSHGPVRSPLYN